jgi:putative transposase
MTILRNGVTTALGRQSSKRYANKPAWLWAASQPRALSASIVSRYDGGKKVKGRKRHLLVDTLGLLIAVWITSAGLDDGQAAPQLLALISAAAFPRLETIFGDNKYHNHDLYAWMAIHRPTWRLEIKTRPEGSTGFTPLRQRWVVERTNAWNGRGRRNSKDYERKPTSSAAMVQLSHINLMLNRWSKHPSPAFHYRQKAA